MKIKIVSFASFIVFVFSFLVWSPNISLAADTPTFGGGAGTVSNPFQITNCQQLQNIDYYSELGQNFPYLNSYFVLNNDIDCSDTVNWNNSLGFDPIGFSTEESINNNFPFAGSFNGQGYKISDLYINRAEDKNNLAVGLFMGVSDEDGVAEIKNVSLVNVDITGGMVVGGLVGVGINSDISQVSVSGSIKSITTFSENANTYGTGGLVGSSCSIEIGNSYTEGIIQGGSSVGGLIGQASCDNEIFNSYSNMEVQAVGNAGGLVGEGEPEIYNSYAVGTVSGSGYIGGLVGYFNGDPNYYIYNSSWYVYPGAENISAVVYNDNQTWETSEYPELDKIVFYSKYHEVYDQDDDYGSWDFIGFSGDPIWYAQGNDFPKFIEKEGGLFAGGTGVEGDPYQIETCQQLQNVKYKALDGYYSGEFYYYILNNDIDCEETRGWNDGQGFKPIGSGEDNSFLGSFDGNNYIISDLYINATNINTERNIGLFGFIEYEKGDETIIKNVGLENVDIIGGVNSHHVGGLVGVNHGGIINKSYVTGSVLMNTDGESAVGGLVGYNDRGHIENTYMIGSVSGGGGTGGLVGYSSSPTTIVNSYTDANVSGYYNIGGLVGYVWGEIIYNSFAVGTVNYIGPINREPNIGGLIGSLGGDDTAQYVFNSNWYAYPEAKNISVFGKINTADINPEPIYNKEVFYNKYASVYDYDNQTGYAWDFATPIWNEQGGALPKFTEYQMFAGGNGTEADPYQIESCEQLQNVRYKAYDEEYYFYKLIEDIDCSETEDWNDGRGFAPIGYSLVNYDGQKHYEFYGSFNGNGYKITDLYINRAFDWNNLINGQTVEVGAGLFGRVIDSTITNVGLENVDITGGKYVGGLIGYSSESEISKSYVTGDVSGTNSTTVGGLVGFSDDSLIANSHTSGNVSNGMDVGGLIGEAADYSSIYNSYSNSDVVGRRNIGGLIGYNNQSEVYNSYSVGIVNLSELGEEYYVGGLVGYFNGDGDPYDDYIYNSGWYQYPDGYYVSGIGYDSYNGGFGEVDHRVSNKEFFYYKYSPVYDPDNETRYAWDFYGFEGDPIWYEQGGGLPKFTEYEFFAGGDGSELNPFQITSCQELQNVRYKLADDGYYYYKVMNDIDCEETEDWNNGRGFDPIGFRQGMEESPDDLPFYGDFNGNNKVISNLYINRTSPENGVMEGFNMGTGLFGFVDGYDEYAEIYNVRLEDVDITGAFSVGGLVGYNLGAVIYHSYVTGDVTGNVDFYGDEMLNNYTTGGLVGYNDQGHIGYTYMTGNVSGGFSTGGLVGYTDGSGCSPLLRVCTILNSYADANVSGDWNVGGLVGSDNQDSIYNSYAVGTVNKTGSTGYVGGLVGYFSGNDSYDDYISNSGWYNYLYPFNDQIGAIGYDLYNNGGNYNTEYTEFSKSAFYSIYHGVYNGGELYWDFLGEDGENPTWYEQLNDLPKFEKQKGGLDYFDGGSGTIEDPFEITSCQQLQNIDRMVGLSSQSDYPMKLLSEPEPEGSSIDYYYKLMNDIDCRETKNWNNGLGFEPIGKMDISSGNRFFSGHFDGNGHVVSNLFIYRPDKRMGNITVGLFEATDGAYITDVGLENVHIIGNEFVGGLIGFSQGGEVHNSYVTGVIEGKSLYDTNYAAGGLIGYNDGGHIENTYTTGTVTGYGNVGGLIGYSVGSESSPRTIVNSYSSSNVNGVNAVGGLIGYVREDNIYNSYATGDTIISDEGIRMKVSVEELYIGGLVGYFDGYDIPYTSFVHNSGWSNDTASYGIGYDYSSYTYGEVTYEDIDKSNFYSKTHDIYDTGELPWNFSEVWVEHADYYPTFEINNEGEDEEEEVNTPPVVNAGSNKSITLPTNTTTLSGSATDSDGTIVSITWAYVSGPEGYVIENPNSLSTKITSLSSAGTYVFRLTATDNDEATANDTVSVTVRNKSSSGGGGGSSGSSSSSGTIGIEGCRPGDIYDMYTGALCSSKTGTSTVPSSTTVPELQTSCVVSGVTFTRTLRLTSPMMVGDDVKALQSYLNCKGYNVGLADGIFGSMTKAGVVLFQRDHGLTQDGIVGPLTRSAILSNQ